MVIFALLQRDLYFPGCMDMLLCVCAAVTFLVPQLSPDSEKTFLSEHVELSLPSESLDCLRAVRT